MFQVSSGKPTSPSLGGRATTMINRNSGSSSLDMVGLTLTQGCLDLRDELRKKRDLPLPFSTAKGKVCGRTNFEVCKWRATESRPCNCSDTFGTLRLGRSAPNPGGYMATSSA